MRPAMLRNTTAFCAGLALGALAASMFDPVRGRARRGLIRDRCGHWARVVRDSTGRISRDVANRARGMRARVGSMIGPSEMPEDWVLAERVRAALGHHVSHPRAIQVTAREGQVVLAGDVLDLEADRMLAAIGRVRGVDRVEDRLERHETSGSVSALQGGPTRRDHERPFWSPPRRLAAGACGGLLAGLAIRQRSSASWLLGGAGAALLARSLTDRPLSRRRPISVDVHKTVRIDAPPERVYGVWADLKNLPRFMSHLAEVRPAGGEADRWLWRAAGPAGLELEWEAEVVDRQENRRIAWRSLPGSTVGSEGAVRFAPDNGGTRVHVQMSYRPPGGAAGHAVARLFGVDPRSAMDEDFTRFKALLEGSEAAVSQR